MESMFQAKENQSQQSQTQPNATPAPVPAAAAPAAQPNPVVGGMDAMFSQKEKAENPPAEQTPPVQHYTAPPGAVTATISAYKPSILERVENMFRYANPNTRPIRLKKIVMTTPCRSSGPRNSGQRLNKRSTRWLLLSVNSPEA